MNTPMTSNAASPANPFGIGAPSFPVSLGADAIRMSSTSGDMSSSLLKLYKTTLEAGHRDRKLALDAMRALWRWISAMMDRLARVFGLRHNAPQNPTEGQLEGNEPTEIGFSADPSGTKGDVPGVEAAAGAATVLEEANRLIKYLAENPVDPSMLANPDTAQEFIRFQAVKLGQYHAVFLARIAELDQEINEKCAAIAQAVGTTGPVIRAQLAGNGELGLYDKDGSVKALIQESKEVRLAKGRVELAAISLVDAASYTSAQPGLREHALQIFAEKMPGVQLDRASPPKGEVAAASGETSAIGGDETGRVLPDAPAPAEAGRAPQPEAGLLARNGIPTKNTLELNGKARPFDVLAPLAATANLRLVQGAVAEPIAAETTKEALKSPFVGGGFAKLEEEAARRRESSKADWGDRPTDR